jgi:hypothetical protein
VLAEVLEFSQDFFAFERSSTLLTFVQESIKLTWFEIACLFLLREL